jgi:hypothetical protein
MKFRTKATLAGACSVTLLGCSAGDGSGGPGDDDASTEPPGIDSSVGYSSDASDGGGADAARDAQAQDTAPHDSAPDAQAFAGETTPFSNADDLCTWLNQQRDGYSNHGRWSGMPISGHDTTNTTWPYHFTIDPAAAAQAQAEADRLAQGGAPAGQAIAVNFMKTLWFDGEYTAALTISSMDVPGDWVPAPLSGDVSAGLSTQNISARQGIYYQDPGGDGPVLTRVGCGASISASGQARYWVIAIRP